MNPVLLENLLFLLFEADKAFTVREKASLLLSAAGVLRGIVEQIEDSKINKIIIYDHILAPKEEGSTKVSSVIKDVKAYELKSKDEIITFIELNVVQRILRYINDNRIIFADYLSILPTLSNNPRTILDTLWGNNSDALVTALKTSHIPLYHFEKAKNFIWQILLQLNPEDVSLVEIRQKLGVNSTKRNSLPTH